MNRIYNKLRTKRRYIRRPLCANLLSLCTRNKCRCDMPIKDPKCTNPITEDVITREKVMNRRHQIDLQKIDNENLEILKNDTILNVNKNSGRNFGVFILKVVYTFIIFTILYLIIINLFDI